MAGSITPRTGNGSRALRAAPVAVLVLAGLMLAGCAETITKHGQQFRDTDLQQVNTGMSQEQVKLTLGSPTTTSAIGGSTTYYYVSSTEAEKVFLSPRETDRQVVAIYFNQAGMVQQVANYGLKDGKVFDFIKRTTPAPGAKDEGILKALFRNLGNHQLFGGG